MCRAGPHHLRAGRAAYGGAAQGKPLKTQQPWSLQA
jgi:hypothetical protein